MFVNMGRNKEVHAALLVYCCTVSGEQSISKES